MHDATLHHSVDDHRIDHAAHIVDGDVPDEIHLARVAVHLDHGDVRAERKHEVPWVEEADRLEPGLEALRQVVRQVRHQRDVAERLEAIRRALHGELAALVDEVVFACLEQVRGDLLPLFLDLLDAEIDRGSADRAAPAAVRSHPERHLAGIAVHDVDVFHRQAQLVGSDLRECRLVSLTVRVRSREDRHLPGRVHAHGRALVQARLRAERAGHLRRRQPAGLDVRGETNPEIPTGLSQAILFLAKRGVVEHPQRLVERGLVIARVVHDGDRRLVRELLRRNEVPPAQLDRIDSQFTRGEIGYQVIGWAG